MPSLQKPREKTAAAFFLAFAIAALIFLPFLLYDHGYFIYYGDFNAQQIPFYSYAHDAVATGDFGWSHLTDLGANFIGSYSFYLLGSPFFWLTIPLPSAALPYLMAPLLMLKIAFASLTAYLFVRRFVRPQLALLGGLLYAFSGFSIYNIFFNHFHEALIYFPLMLWAMERYMQDGKRGGVAFSVLLSALSNYYFFIGQSIFLLIYWLVRLISGSYQGSCSFGKCFWLFFEAAAGTAGAAILLLPSYLAVIQNNRVDAPLLGWDLLIYSAPQRFWDIIHSFFFPQDNPARPNFFPDADNRWASMSAWIPLFGCTGVLGYMQSRRHTDWLRRLLTALIFCALIPGLNAMFQLFNRMYYARWFYMLVLMMVLATLLCFEENDQKPVNWKRACGWAMGCTAFFALFVGLIPASLTPSEDTGTIQLGLYKDQVRFWIYAAIAGICLLLTALLISLFRRDKKIFCHWSIGVTAAIVLLYSWYAIGYGKMTANYRSEFVIRRAIEGGSEISLPDSGFTRIDIHDGMDNLALFWRLPSIQAFHSIVPGSVMEFYPTVGVIRTVASRPNSDHYALRSFLSVRWLFDYDNADQLDYKETDDYFEQDGETAMPGYTYYDTQNGYRIYENQNYIPMGFAYTHYIPRSVYDTLTLSERELVLLKALVVEDEDIPAVSDLLNELDTDTAEFTEQAYDSDCALLQSRTADSFSADSGGFTAAYTGTDERILFFSVPFENGWSATVNGQLADILKTAVGFMAVRCAGDGANGQNTVVFTYRTPGLTDGMYISAGAVGLLLLYLLIMGIWDKKHRAPVMPPENISDSPFDLTTALLSAAPQIYTPVQPEIRPQDHDNPDAIDFDLYKMYPEQFPPEK